MASCLQPHEGHDEDGELHGVEPAGELDVRYSGDGEHLYRRCTRSDPHHHLLCRSCGHTVEVADPPVERWAARVAAEHGFADVSHTLEIFGTCAECAARG